MNEAIVVNLEDVRRLRRRASVLGWLAFSDWWGRHYGHEARLQFEQRVKADADEIAPVPHSVPENGPESRADTGSPALRCTIPPSFPPMEVWRRKDRAPALLTPGDS